MYQDAHCTQDYHYRVSEVFIHMAILFMTKVIVKHLFLLQHVIYEGVDCCVEREVVGVGSEFWTVLLPPSRERKRLCSKV
jgi:hypothetical protein